MATQAFETAKDVEQPEDVPIVSSTKEKQNYGSKANSHDDGLMSKNKNAEEEHKLLPDTPDGRHPSLDVIRIVCIWLACVDHGETPFGYWNTMYVQSWVLQYLFLICGICFGMTKKGLPSYLSRLGMYFVIGVCCNWVAWAIAGLDWKHNSWDIVFQFWFVFGLMMYCVALYPFKQYLARVKNERRTSESSWAHFARGVAVLVLGFAVIKLLFRAMLIPIMQKEVAAPLANAISQMGSSAQFWGVLSDPHDAATWCGRFLTYLESSLASVYLVMVSPYLFSRLSAVGWLVIANNYYHRCFEYRGQDSRIFTGFDVTFLGLTCFYFGLQYRRVIGEYFVRYWFLFLFICALLWPPGTTGRWDEQPPTDPTKRLAYNFMEMIFVVFFLCAAERMADPKIFSEDRMDFMGNFTLLLFLVHKAVYILVPQPYCWYVILSLIPFCYTIQVCCSKPRRQPEQSAACEAVLLEKAS